MADEPDKEPQTPDEAIKALRQHITRHTAVMDEMASVLETHDARIMLLMRQGIFLTIGLTALIILLKRLSKEVDAHGRAAQ